MTSVMGHFDDIGREHYDHSVLEHIEEKGMEQCDDRAHGEL